MLSGNGQRSEKTSVFAEDGRKATADTEVLEATEQAVGMAVDNI
jgi:hypothetical protein